MDRFRGRDGRKPWKCADVKSPLVLAFDVSQIGSAINDSDDITLIDGQSSFVHVRGDRFD